MATATEQALIDAATYGDPIAGLPNIDITPGYGYMMDSLGWQGALLGLGEDIVKGRPDLGGKIGIPSDVREGGGYPQKLEDFLPGFTPAWIRDPLTRLSDSLYEDALKPRYIEEYREGDPTWIQDWNPDRKPDWDDTDLLYAPEQRAFPDKWDQSSGVYTDEILPRPIPEQLGSALAQTGMEPYVGSTPVSQALQGISPRSAETAALGAGTVVPIRPPTSSYPVPDDRMKTGSSGI